jgi:hypothetical protein
MERVPQELVDKFIDELKDDDQSLRVCSLISSRWVDRSRHHLFQKVVFMTAQQFARYCNLFPTDHRVQSYIRGVALVQRRREPWVTKQVLHHGLEHLNVFRALESLILDGITNGSMQSCSAIEALANDFETAAPSVKSLKLVHWRVSPIPLVEFICRFPSLDNLIVKDMAFLVGLPDWNRPSKFPPFAGRLESNDRNGHNSTGRFLRLLSRLPLGFREISIRGADFPGALDPIITILEKCSPVLVKVSLHYGYQLGMSTFFFLSWLDR